MRQRFAAVTAIVSAAVMTAVATEMPRLRPGQYERTIATVIQGRSPGVPRKSLQCVTADDIKDFSRAMNTRSQQPGCSVVDYKQSASGVSYTQICTVADGMRVTSKATVTFPTDETFRALVETTSTGGPASDTFAMLKGSTITVTARRIGDCTR